MCQDQQGPPHLAFLRQPYDASSHASRRARGPAHGTRQALLALLLLGVVSLCVPPMAAATTASAAAASTGPEQAVGAASSSGDKATNGVWIVVGATVAMVVALVAIAVLGRRRQRGGPGRGSKAVPEAGPADSTVGETPPPPAEGDHP